jgi:hypothetical protein
MKRAIKITSIVAVSMVVIAVALLTVWQLLIPGPDHHRCPRYVLWKHGLYPLNTNVVYQCLTPDPDRDSVVAGLTVSQLEQRFKHLRTRETANEYQRYYNPELPPDVRWLGDSPWVVIFTNGTASELRLMKG